jgi:hypothetical protein
VEQTQEEYEAQLRVDQGDNWSTVADDGNEMSTAERERQARAQERRLRPASNHPTRAVRNLPRVFERRGTRMSAPSQPSRRQVPAPRRVNTPAAVTHHCPGNVYRLMLMECTLLQGVINKCGPVYRGKQTWSQLQRDRPNARPPQCVLLAWNGKHRLNST